MTERREDLRWLQGWYIDQCNGDWEHQQGVKIDTIDNPGWHIQVDLEGTSLEHKHMPPMEVHRSEHDWLLAKVENHRFDGVGGPDNLGELIHIFRLWATEKPPRATGDWSKADREGQRRRAQEIVNRLLQDAQVQSIELRDTYIIYFSNRHSNTESMLTTLWNFCVWPAVQWPESLLPTQKQALALYRMLFKVVRKAECRENGGLVIECYDDIKLEVYPEQHPIIEQFWSLTELGSSISGGASKLMVDTVGRYTIWQPDGNQEN